jgi:hypothetical protein
LISPACGTATGTSHTVLDTVPMGAPGAAAARLTQPASGVTVSVTVGLADGVPVSVSVAD